MKTDDINRMIQEMIVNRKEEKPVKTENFENLLPAPKKIYEANRVSKSPLEKGKNG